MLSMVMDLGRVVYAYPLMVLTTLRLFGSAMRHHVMADVLRADDDVARQFLTAFPT
jgi:hypothetical protein